MIPTISDIEQAAKRINKYIHHTPVMTSHSINRMTGAEIYFKCENFQKAGAFKFRGACNAVFSLDDDSVRNGVATHSSGNHAAALALAASLRGIRSYIVMPENAPEIKKKAVTGYGAEITFCKPTLEARETTLASIVKRTSATVIHPYNNFSVICGQGTCALELPDKIKDPDIIMTPVGGGGLLSGTAITVSSIYPTAKVYAAEPAGADDAYRSFKNGKLIPSVEPSTIADGLLTSLGDLNFQIIKKYVDDILTASEENIIKAMQMIWERMKIIIEPSSAVPLAVILEHPRRFQGKKVAIILTGGNADLMTLPFWNS
jgi:threonine dehydratase